MQAGTFEITAETMDHSLRLFSVFSSEDAMRLFLYTERGITSSTQAMKDLGLTQKRYYSRLKALLNLGLIEKIDGTYRYTALGKVIRKLGLYLMGVLNNREKIKLLNTITQTELLSSSEIDQITKIISAQSDEFGSLLNSIINEREINELETLETFEKLVNKVAQEIDVSQSSILIATNYLDPRVMNASLKSLKRGVTMKALFSKDQLSSKLTKFKLLITPKYIITLLAFCKSSINLNEVLREGEIPFSFVVIDNYKCVFELPNFQEEFSIAFYLGNEGTAKKFSDLFYRLWDVGKTSEMIGLLEKSSKIIE